MTHRPYPAYKDSGVEWLGEVPEHWEVKALGKISTEKCDGPFGSGITSEHYTDTGALVVRLQNIKEAGFVNGEPASEVPPKFDGFCHFFRETFEFQSESQIFT